MVIRPAQPADIGDILDLWAESREQLLPTDNSAALELLLDRDPAALLIAVPDERVVGSLIASWDGWRGNMYRLAVHPRWRRRGIATRLVTAGENRLRRLGARRVSALVWHDDARAVQMWRSVGYDSDDGTGRFVKSVRP